MRDDTWHDMCCHFMVNTVLCDCCADVDGWPECNDTRHRRSWTSVYREDYWLQGQQPTNTGTGELAHAWFLPFHSIATTAVAHENGIGGNVFPSTPLTKWPERWLAVQLWKNGKNRIRSYLLRNGSYGAMAAGTATAQQNFSCMQRNSYAAYGILT